MILQQNSASSSPTFSVEFLIFRDLGSHRSSCPVSKPYRFRTKINSNQNLQFPNFHFRQHIKISSDQPDTIADYLWSATHIFFELACYILNNWTGPCEKGKGWSESKTFPPPSIWRSEEAPRQNPFVNLPAQYSDGHTVRL